MANLVVLGSKPEPVLPARETIDALACANASGYSAAKLGLPDPAYTLMSAILTSGIPSGRQSLAVLAGLRTDELYFFPRPPRTGRSLKATLRGMVGGWRTRPSVLRRALRRVGYRYQRMRVHEYDFFRALVEDLCDRDVDILARMAVKQPSTGLMTIALGLASGRYRRVILSGFSFELSHAYGDNPEIAQRGTRVSRHADTDVAVLHYLASRRDDLFTSEPVVHERTGIPLFRGL